MKALNANHRRSINNAELGDRKSSEALDLNTVKRTSDFTPRTRPRIFGIQEAPTYYPTPEEFKDPIQYIQTIRPEAEKFGIIKIVPPATYKPDFSLNTEEFRFRTRIQKLNSMEGETRANVNYLEQLYKFHRVNGHPVSKVPQLDKRPIDLFKLKKEVHRRGGYQMVTQQKKWAEIGRILGYTRKQCTSMSNALKSAYNRVILPYEVWLADHLKEASKTSTSSSSSSSNQGMKRVAPKREPSVAAQDNSKSGQECDVCHADGQELLLCDGCDRSYHLSCLSPPLSSMPKNEWFCVKCLTATGDDYGFEDGEEYTLKAFQDVCNNFKREWFAQKGIKEPVSEEDCEDEFWRLVENPHETCEVEYGADLHSTNHGSGFPSQERVDEIDPWNLNVIPVLPKSLFTHIKTDISGMMVPWLYIGMCFSAFCWHNEDHFTYSINYMHWGETKTWYGIPGSDTTLFEEAMKRAVPELFEQQPDLLFQLVTMLSPGRLMKENVRVYAVDQRPGQFVVTFPKSYHSGFNHGFNFCEAVNFAPPEWVEFGRECVARYKAFRRQPCFSHDELLITTLMEDKFAEGAPWLTDALSEMQRREMASREQIRKKFPKLNQVYVDSELPEEQQQCTYCNCYAYLSQIACNCTNHVACLDHYAELCTCDMSQKTLRLRYADEQLEGIVQQSMKLSSAPSDWSTRLHEVLNSQPGPSLKTLRHLLNEAERLSVPEEECQSLRKFVSQISEWTEEATKYLVRKHQPRRRESKEQEPLNKNAYLGERYQRITELVDQAVKMSFDAPEIKLLKDTLKGINQFKEKAAALLATPTPDLDDCKAVFNAGVAAGADVPEMYQLATIIHQREWWETAPPALNDPDLTYSRVVTLLEQADQCHIPHDHDVYRVLSAKRELGADWVKQAEALIHHHRNPRHTLSLEDLEAILRVSPNVPTEPHLMSAVQAMTSTVTDTLKGLASVTQYCKQPPAAIADRRSETELERLLQNTSTLPLRLDDVEALKIQRDKLNAWHTELKRLLTVPRSSSTQQVLEDILQNVKTITTSVDNTEDVYCVCRTSESGLMIECDVCHEWYHGPCIKVTRREAKAQSTYVCPICQGKPVPHTTKRPKLQELQTALDHVGTLAFAPKTYPCLLEIVSLMRTFQDRVQAFCRSKKQLGREDMVPIRQYTRLLEGLRVLLDDETEFLQGKIKALSSHDQLATHVPQPTQQRTPSLSPTISSLDSVSGKDATRICVCQDERPDAPTVACDVCHSAYHTSCVNLSQPANGNFSFICKTCDVKEEMASTTQSPTCHRPIIRLTLKPPVQQHVLPSCGPVTSSVHETKRRKHSASHDNGRIRKHRRVSAGAE